LWSFKIMQIIYITHYAGRVTNISNIRFQDTCIALEAPESIY